MARHARPKAAVTIALLACLWATPVQGQSLDGLWEVTAYACPPYCGLTASGVQVGPQSIAAPSWVPFGTQLCISGWGCGVVQDRGGAIHGRRLDVFLPSHEAAMQWGRRWVNVTSGGVVSPETVWLEVLEDFIYLDEGVPVRKVVTNSNRGLATTYEVLR